jgi:hypothetical protein
VLQVFQSLLQEVMVVEVQVVMERLSLESSMLPLDKHYKSLLEVLDQLVQHQEDLVVEEQEEVQIQALMLLVEAVVPHLFQFLLLH